MTAPSYSETVAAASEATDAESERLFAYASRLESGSVDVSNDTEVLCLTLALGFRLMSAALREVGVTVGMRD